MAHRGRTVVKRNCVVAKGGGELVGPGIIADRDPVGTGSPLGRAGAHERASIGIALGGGRRHSEEQSHGRERRQVDQRGDHAGSVAVNAGRRAVQAAPISRSRLRTTDRHLVALHWSKLLQSWDWATDRTSTVRLSSSARAAPTARFFPTVAGL